MHLSHISTVACVALSLSLTGCASATRPAATASSAAPTVQAAAPAADGIAAEADVAMCKLARYLMNSSARAAPVEATMIQVAAKRGDASQPLRKDARALADAYLSLTGNADATAQASAKIAAYCAPLGITMP